MIEFKNLNNEKPYKVFKEKYEKALNFNQLNIEAVSISSFNKGKDEVDSRYVNVKLIDDEKFIFFTNYNSPKSIGFKSHNQISALFFWPVINTQIRMKAIIKKTSLEFNQTYFEKRSREKNALAISSNQSKKIKSYKDVIEKYNHVFKKSNLDECPRYWGGYSFIPYYFEFWEGHESRINKREVFNKIDGFWKHSFLQP
jgi:pyridoxamine 5'-phosphate oxidase